MLAGGRWTNQLTKAKWKAPVPSIASILTRLHKLYEREREAAIAEELELLTGYMVYITAARTKPHISIFVALQFLT